MIYNSNSAKPTIITGEQWGRKVSIELPNSDTDIHELLDIFKGIAMGLGYDEASWNYGITELAESIQDTEISDSLSGFSDDELGEAIAEFNHLESLDD